MATDYQPSFRPVADGPLARRPAATDHGRGLWLDEDGNLWRSDGTTWTLALSGTYAPAAVAEYQATAYGVKADGTDQTANLIALIAAVYAAGGGDIVLAGMVRCDGQIVIPTDGGAINPFMPSQPPIRIRGRIADQNGSTRGAVGVPYTTTGGLDLRYNGRAATIGTTAGSNVVTDPGAVATDVGKWVLHPNIPDRAQIDVVTPGVGYTMVLNTVAGVNQPANAYATGAGLTARVVGGRIESMGNGYLEIDHLTINILGGTSSAPFGWSVDTVVNLHHNNFCGAVGKADITCDEDIWVFGGTLRTTSPGFMGGDRRQAFQGYGSMIWANHFDHVRRMLFQSDVSSTWVEHNVWWQGCGSNLTGSTTLTSALVSGNSYSALAVAALTKPVWNGDTIQLGTGTTIQQVTANADAAVGAASISVGTFTASAAFAIGVLVTDYTTGLSAPIEWKGNADQNSLPSIISNRFEANRNYTHIGIFENCSNGVVCFNEVQDSNAATVARWRTGTGANGFLFIPGSSTTSLPLIDDLAGNPHVVLDMRANQPSVFNFVQAKGLSSVWTDGWSPKVQDAAGNVWQTRSTGTGSKQLDTRYTPAGGAVETIMSLIRSSSAAYQYNFGGTSTATLLAVLEMRLQSAAGARVKIGDPTFVGNVAVVGGCLETTHHYAVGTVPTVAAAASSTAVSITGRDQAHTVLFTTADGVAADVAVATVTYNGSWAGSGGSATTKPRFSLAAKNGASVAAGAYITGNSATGYSIALHTPPATATALAFDVVVLGAAD